MRRKPSPNPVYVRLTDDEVDQLRDIAYEENTDLWVYDQRGELVWTYLCSEIPPTQHCVHVTSWGLLNPLEPLAKRHPIH